MKYKIKIFGFHLMTFLLVQSLVPAFHFDAFAQTQGSGAGEEVRRPPADSDDDSVEFPSNTPPPPSAAQPDEAQNNNGEQTAPQAAESHSPSAREASQAATPVPTPAPEQAAAPVPAAAPLTPTPTPAAPVAAQSQAAPSEQTAALAAASAMNPQRMQALLNILTQSGILNREGILGGLVGGLIDSMGGFEQLGNYLAREEAAIRQAHPDVPRWWESPAIRTGSETAAILALLHTNNLNLTGNEAQDRRAVTGFLRDPARAGVLAAGASARNGAPANNALEQNEFMRNRRNRISVWGGAGVGYNHSNGVAPRLSIGTEFHLEVPRESRDARGWAANGELSTGSSIILQGNSGSEINADFVYNLTAPSSSVGIDAGAGLNMQAAHVDNGPGYSNLTAGASLRTRFFRDLISSNISYQVGQVGFDSSAATSFGHLLRATLAIEIGRIFDSSCRSSSMAAMPSEPAANTAPAASSPATTSANAQTTATGTQARPARRAQPPQCVQLALRSDWLRDYLQEHEQAFRFVESVRIPVGDYAFVELSSSQAFEGGRTNIQGGIGVGGHFDVFDLIRELSGLSRVVGQLNTLSSVVGAASGSTSEALPTSPQTSN